MFQCTLSRYGSGGEIVAGEIGYAVGGVYTSLSGFSFADSAGTIQCCAVAKMLQTCNFDFWDLGMAIEYKLKLGAHEENRKAFLELLFASRDRSDLVLS